jgi:hypothetical protein
VAYDSNPCNTLRRKIDKDIKHEAWLQHPVPLISIVKQFLIPIFPQNRMNHTNPLPSGIIMYSQPVEVQSEYLNMCENKFGYAK